MLTVSQDRTARSRMAALLLLSVVLALTCVGCSKKSSGSPSGTATQTSSPEIPSVDDFTNTYTGTCMILSASELLSLQGYSDDPAAFGSADDMFAIVYFNPPQVMNARFAGDPEAIQEEETDLICVAISGSHTEGDLNYWRSYDGQQVTIQIDPMKTMWPSDVRLPLGSPHTGSAVVVS